MDQGSILHSSLNKLLNQRFSVLSHKFKGAKHGRHSNGFRSAANDVLLDLIRKEILVAFSEFFGEPPQKTSDKNPPEQGCCCKQGEFNSCTQRPFPGIGNGGVIFDNRQMEVMIDQMVAESLMYGRQTTGILRSLFGIIPSLIGR
jgi:hypothetical protein